MTVANIAESLSLTPIVVPDGNRVCAGAYVGDLLSWVMGRAKSGDVWITIMSNINIIAVASLADVACIVLAEGVALDETVKTTALAKGINVYTSEKTAYELAALLASILK